MKLHLNLKDPGSADGIYQIKAGGCMAASLQWADEKGPLEDWTAFAYIPLNGNGCGTFRSGAYTRMPETYAYGGRNHLLCNE